MITRSQTFLSRKRRLQPSDSDGLGHQDSLDLPLELKEIVISRMASNGGIELLSALRLVSKSWRAAVEQSPRRVICCNANQANNLEALCAIFPSMVHLGIYSVCASTNLDLLAKLRCLKSVTLSPYWKMASQPSLRVSSLPASVTDMSSDRVRLLPEQLEKPILPHLTMLELRWASTEEAASAWKLCSQLPQVKELRIGTGNYHREEALQEAFEGPLVRMSALTKLKLSKGQLCKPPQTWKGPPNIRELKLEYLKLSEVALNSLGKELSHLTLLDIDDCRLERTKDQISLEAMTSLLSLKLEASPSKLLELAGSDLQQLQYVMKESLPGNTLSRLTALTRVVLSKVKGPIPALPAEALRQIRQLVLMDCPRVESAIFVPGSLVSLEQLHIEVSKECSDDSDYDQEGNAVYVPNGPSKEHTEELRRAGDVIMGLGKLRRISGGCYLLHDTLCERLSAWQFLDMSRGDLGVPFKPQFHQMQTWIKA